MSKENKQRALAHVMGVLDGKQDIPRFLDSYTDFEVSDSEEDSDDSDESSDDEDYDSDSSSDVPFPPPIQVKSRSGPKLAAAPAKPGSPTPPKAVPAQTAVPKKPPAGSGRRSPKPAPAPAPRMAPIPAVQTFNTSISTTPVSTKPTGGSLSRMEQMMKMAGSPNTNPAAPSSPSPPAAVDTKKIDNLTENLAAAESKLGQVSKTAEQAKQEASMARQENEASQAKAAELQQRMMAIKERLEEKTNEARELQAENQVKEAKLAKLRDQMKDTEKNLNRSYDDTLGELTTLVEVANEKIHELGSDNQQLSFNLTEANRVVKFMEEKMANFETESKGQVAEMQFKLTEANRVSQFVQSKMNMTPDEKEEEMKKIMDARAEQLGQHQVKIDGLVDDVASLEHRLKESTKDAKAARETSEAAEKEKEMFKSKAYELGSRLSALKQLLQEKEDHLQSLQSTSKALDTKIGQYKTEMRSTENMLNKSYNETLEGLTNHIKESEEQINELANENQSLQFQVFEANRIVQFLTTKLENLERESKGEIASLSFKNHEAKRVSKFLEGKLNTMFEAKRDTEKSLSERDTEVAELQAALAHKEAMLVQQEKNHKTTVAESSKYARQVIEVEAKLTTSNRINHFLQTTLSTTETEMQARDLPVEAVEAIDGLKESLAESQKLAEMLQDSLNMALLERQTLSARVSELECMLADKPVLEVVNERMTAKALNDEDLGAKLLKLKTFADTALRGIRADESMSFIQ
jgi:chromosome segregation ATPase